MATTGTAGAISATNIARCTTTLSAPEPALDRDVHVQGVYATNELLRQHAHKLFEGTIHASGGVEWSVGVRVRAVCSLRPPAACCQSADWDLSPRSLPLPLPPAASPRLDLLRVCVVRLPAIEAAAAAAG